MSNQLSRRTALGAALFSPAIGAMPKGGATAAAYPVVETAAGKVRGFVNRGVAVFRGIP
jgi:hypothetical protein